MSANAYPFLDAPEATDVSPAPSFASDPGPSWTHVQLIAFRFVFICLAVYTYQLWREYWGHWLPGAGWYQSLIGKGGAWLGDHVLLICASPQRSAAPVYGEMAYYCWINEIVLLVSSALVLTVIWSLVDRK